MPGDEQTQLRVYSSGGWPVADTIEFLQAFNSAYDRLLVFDAFIQSYEARSTRILRRVRPPEYSIFFGDSNITLAAAGISDDELGRFITPRDELVLQRVQLASPGFWEFLGSLLPLEVLRKYLNDRHSRRQDREYREPAERRRLELENLIRENEFLQGRIALARELGITNAELTPMLNNLVYAPLERLDALAAKGMITSGDPNTAEPDADTDQR